MRTLKDPSASAKQKLLTIDIHTDHTGPHGMPLVYGSTPDKVGTIKGTVKFSTNYDCRGRDIVIIYEAKAEAQWTALENKKIVNHHTEEILGHHVWHFPLVHTKPGGFTVVAGDYEKTFEVPLIHPTLLNPPSTLSLSTGSGGAASSTYNPIKSNIVSSATPGAAKIIGLGEPTSLLLPSSSDSPHAKMKYTIRAILRRPFPSINNIEASQEVWVLHSCLPLPSSVPPAASEYASASLSAVKLPRSSPSAVADGDHKQACGSDGTVPLVLAGSTAGTAPLPQHPQTPDSTQQEQQPILLQSTLPSAADKDSSSASTSDQSSTKPVLISLSGPTKAIKTALSMLPTIDLSRPRQLLALSLPSLPTPLSPKFPPPSATAATVTSATLPAEQSTTHMSQEQARAQLKLSSMTSSHSNASTSIGSESTSLASSTSSRSSSASEKYDRHASLDEYLSSDEDGNTANYTGVWEPFEMPYSCSLPSETAFLGQMVPLTIRFGPSRRDGRGRGQGRRRRDQKRKDKEGKKPSHRKHGQDVLSPFQEPSPLQPPQGPRFVVKKGIVKVVEHTLLREVTITSQPVKLRRQNQSLVNSRHTTSAGVMTGSVFKPSRSSQESQFTKEQQQLLSPSPPQTVGIDNSVSKNEISGSRRLLMIPGLRKKSSQQHIYQEKGYSGSHSHIYDLLQHEAAAANAAQHQQHVKFSSGSESAIPQQQQQQQQQRRSDANDIKRFFFKLKRHSMDYSPPQGLPPSSPTKSTFQGTTSPSPTSVSSKGSSSSGAKTRIINSIEAKFKTEVTALIVTPQLQTRERMYQRVLRRRRKEQGHYEGSETEESEEEEKEKGGGSEEREQQLMAQARREEEDGIWQTTVYVQLPGPLELGTFTETKHIARKHTLQLILLCGLVSSDRTVTGAAPGPTAGSSVVSPSDLVITQPGINKEFRLEMDLHVTGPRAPM
ncbi:hypothetical protein EDD11_000024 [Mortierella claussenii]|nr:hypothetical protein EDD11_000024 [Mortierella claussenii]